MLETCATVKQIKNGDKIGYVSTRTTGRLITQASLRNVADRNTADGNMQSIIDTVQGIRSSIHKRAAGTSFVVSRDDLSSVEENVERVQHFLRSLNLEKKLWSTTFDACVCARPAL